MDKFNPTHEQRMKAALGLHAILFMRDPKKELDDARVLLYWRQLERFPIETVEQAAFELQGKIRKFPLPADLVEACEVVEARKARASDPGAPNPRPPGAQPWCDNGCDDTGWITISRPLRELRDIAPEDPIGDVVHSAVHRCSCWKINPVRKWRERESRAGGIRREEKADAHNPQRKGQLVPFRREG